MEDEDESYCEYCDNPIKTEVLREQTIIRNGTREDYYLCFCSDYCADGYEASR